MKGTLNHKAGENKLNIGCGGDIKTGWINLDIIQLKGVDTVADLDACQVTPLPYADNTFDEIYAGHVFEYIKKPLALMQELYRISNPGAKAVIKVFYGSSDEAMEDPACERLYFIGSFGYFSQPFYWRADYGYRGDWQTEKITLSVDAARYSGKSNTIIMNDVNRLRNVVKEMAVEMKAIKPFRNADKNLQTPQQIEIVFS